MLRQSRADPEIQLVNGVIEKSWPDVDVEKEFNCKLARKMAAQRQKDQQSLSPGGHHKKETK